MGPLLGSSPALVLLEVGLGLGALLAFLWWMTGRLHGPRREGSSKVIRLTAQDSVHVVSIDGRRLLVGTGSGGPPRLLCELGDAPLESTPGERSDGGR